MSNHLISVEIDLPENTDLRKVDRIELGKGMNPELKKFEQWFTKNGNQGLTKIESAILKTFIAWKLLFD